MEQRRQAQAMGKKQKKQFSHNVALQYRHVVAEFIYYIIPMAWALRGSAPWAIIKLFLRNIAHSSKNIFTKHFCNCL